MYGKTFETDTVYQVSIEEFYNEKPVNAFPFHYENQKCLFVDHLVRHYIN